ncbi:MAG TPA: heavy-metal-associated domain-containing protein [Ktedonobacteraceae bacterium]|jgi:copper chaperone CopZ
MREEIVVSIPRIKCGGCLKNVTNTLHSLPGVEIVTSDLTTKTLHLRYETEQTSFVQMKTALADARYPIEHEYPASPSEVRERD